MKRQIITIFLISMVLTACGSKKSDDEQITVTSASEEEVIVDSIEIEETKEKKTPEIYWREHDKQIQSENHFEYEAESVALLHDIPDYEGSPYAIVNDNEPFFSEDDMEMLTGSAHGKGFDALGRSRGQIACLSRINIGNGQEEPESHFHPTGWQNKKYQGVIDGGWLYVRCRLVSWQLRKEVQEDGKPDAEEIEIDNKNGFITGTVYFSTVRMLPFENKVADYIKETGNAVLYRVTPVFKQDNLLASGVLMEAYSLEDEGEGIKFCVFVYNVQPGIEIDYATGENKLAEDTETESSSQEESESY